MTGLATGEGGITGLATGVAADGTATAAQSITACWLLYEAPLRQYPSGHQRGAGGDAVLERDLLPEGEIPRGHSESVGATGAALATSAISRSLATSAIKILSRI